MLLCKKGFGEKQKGQGKLVVELNAEIFLDLLLEIQNFRSGKFVLREIEVD